MIEKKAIPPKIRLMADMLEWKYGLKDFASELREIARNLGPDFYEPSPYDFRIPKSLNKWPVP